MPKAYWQSQVWGKLTLFPDQSLPESWPPSSLQRFKILCECGRIITPRFSNVTHAQRSCGKCDWKGKDYWLSQSFGSLSIIDTPDLPLEGGSYSEHKVSVHCDCGNNNIVRFSDINKHGTKSCGRCNHQPQEYWLSKSYGKLTLVRNQPLPDAWGPGTTKKMLFTCTCGKQRTYDFDRVSSGHNKSCDHCLDQSREYWLSQTWGNIHIDPNQDLPEFLGRGSNILVKVICRCGNQTIVRFYDLTGGKVKSCNSCTWNTKEYWASQHWGDLILDVDKCHSEKWAPTSHDVFPFICKCGKKLDIIFSSVTTGNTKSCGECSWKSREYWLTQRWERLRLDSDQKLPLSFGQWSKTPVHL